MIWDKLQLILLLLLLLWLYAIYINWATKKRVEQYIIGNRTFQSHELINKLNCQFDVAIFTTIDNIRLVNLYKINIFYLKCNQIESKRRDGITRQESKD